MRCAVRLRRARDAPGASAWGRQTCSSSKRRASFHQKWLPAHGAAQVRDRSGAPLHEVKAALVASCWNADDALEELRKRGLSAVSKKAARTASEGLVGVASLGRTAVLVELNTETDFIARMPQFQVRAAANHDADAHTAQALVASVAEAALQAQRERCEHPHSSLCVPPHSRSVAWRSWPTPSYRRFF